MQIANSQTDSPAPADTLDARGLNCPMPVIRTRKSLAGIATGQVLRVIATDPGSVADIAAFCKQTGNALIASGERDGAFHFDIRKS